MTDLGSAVELSRRYSRFLIPDVVHIEPGRGNLPHLMVEHMGSIADIYFQGAHVTQYSPPHAQSVLFLSNACQFAGGRPIRGGVPLIFPWVGRHPTNPELPAHGFVRKMQWTLRDIRRHSNRIAVEFSLRDTPETLSFWPHPFELRYVVRVSTSLEIAMSVRNTGAAPFTYEEAMQAYLAVGDVRRITIHGLEGRDYLDRTQGDRRIHDTGSHLTIHREIDRLYLGTRETLKIREISGREVTVTKTGSQATGIWNPWIGKASILPDFGGDEWPYMLCVETVNAADCAITLAPGEHHTVTTVISVANSRR